MLTILIAALMLQEAPRPFLDIGNFHCEVTESSARVHRDTVTERHSSEAVADFAITAIRHQRNTARLLESRVGQQRDLTIIAGDLQTTFLDATPDNAGLITIFPERRAGDTERFHVVLSRHRTVPSSRDAFATQFYGTCKAR